MTEMEPIRTLRLRLVGGFERGRNDGLVLDIEMVSQHVRVCLSFLGIMILRSCCETRGSVVNNVLALATHTHLWFALMIPIVHILLLNCLVY